MANERAEAALTRCDRLAGFRMLPLFFFAGQKFEPQARVRCRREPCSWEAERSAFRLLPFFLFPPFALCRRRPSRDPCRGCGRPSSMSAASGGSSSFPFSGLRCVCRLATGRALPVFIAAIFARRILFSPPLFCFSPFLRVRSLMIGDGEDDSDPRKPAGLLPLLFFFPSWKSIST